MAGWGASHNLNSISLCYPCPTLHPSSSCLAALVRKEAFNNFYDAIQAHPDLSKLKAAVDLPGQSELKALLKDTTSSGKLTLLAPHDDAFDAFLAALKGSSGNAVTIDSVMDDERVRSHVSSVLHLHLLADSVPSRDFPLVGSSEAHTSVPLM